MIPHDITNRNYYSNEVGMRYCSVSQVKAFANCEYQAMAELTGECKRETSESMVLGSYVDAMLLEPETVQTFLDMHPEMVSSRGATKGQLLAKFRHGEDMVARAKQDPLFMKMLEGDHQVILTGEIFCVPFRAKLDNLNLRTGFICDLKTTSDPTQEFYNKELQHYENFAQHFGYDLQAAVYTELVYQNTGRRLPFYLAVVSSQAHPRLEILQIDEESQRLALEKYKDLIETIPLIKSGEIKPTPCGHCDYCADTLPAKIHDWLHREEE